MADFFDQICKVLAETESRRPGSVAPGTATAEFFGDLKPAVPAVKAPDIPAAVPQPAPVMQTAVPACHGAVQRKETTAPVVPSGSLAALRESVVNCRRCGLCRCRQNPVFGEGDPNARLMFIGEGPGADEDATGRPFVGKAGQLLDKMITAMQFSREEVYIANIVKCRPPDNRVPAPEEAACCIPFLQQQIALVRPEVIVLLGAVAVKYLLNTTTGIMKMRGRWTSYENIPVMPTFHPAFLLRQESAKKEAWQDLQQVMARFGKYHKR